MSAHWAQHPSPQPVAESAVETTKRGLASEAKPAIEESDLEFLGCLSPFLPVWCAAVASVQALQCLNPTLEGHVAARPARESLSKEFEIALVLVSEVRHLEVEPVEVDHCLLATSGPGEQEEKVRKSLVLGFFLSVVLPQLVVARKAAAEQ